MRIDSAAVGGLLCILQHARHVASMASPIVPLAEVELHRRQLNIHGGLRIRGIDRRQATSSTSATATATGASAAQWSGQVESACMQSMNALNGKANNPSGMAACYNVPFLDMKTGIFEAELRMYQISAPTAEWTGVTTKEMMVSLAYLGATVQRTNGTLQGVQPNIPAKREIQISEAELLKRAALEQRQSNTPNEIKVLTYVGQLNGNIIGPQMNETQIQALLIPEIELMASNPSQNNQMVYSVLSSKQASFVKGVFSDASTNTISPATAASASALANSARAFVIPGVTLAFFPVGLVVTGVWMVLFVGAVGAGTVGRYRFADQYRRRMRTAGAASVKTI